MIIRVPGDPSSPSPRTTLTTSRRLERSSSTVVVRFDLITVIWRRKRRRWTMDDGPPLPASLANRLSVDSSKGLLVLERMDSIRNLFGCELRIVAAAADDDNDDGGSGAKNKPRTITFAVSRLQSEYKALDDRLIDRLKVSFRYIILLLCSTYWIVRFEIWLGILNVYFFSSRQKRFSLESSQGVYYLSSYKTVKKNTLPERLWQSQYCLAYTHTHIYLSNVYFGFKRIRMFFPPKYAIIPTQL